MPAQMLYLFVTSIVPTVPGAWLTFADGAVYQVYDIPQRLWGISVTSDQQVAGLIMKLVGGTYLWVLIAGIFFTWAGRHARRRRAGRVAHRARGAHLGQGPARVRAHPRPRRALTPTRSGPGSTIQGSCVPGQKSWGVLVLVAAAVLAVVSPAAAEEPADPASPGAALVELSATTGIAGLPELGPGVCKSVDAGSVLTALVCGKLPVDPPACNDLTDGRPTDPAAVDAFEQGWVHRALELQRRLDLDLPLRDALIPHTHNSFNAGTEWPSAHHLGPEPALLDDRPAADGDAGHRARRPLPARTPPATPPRACRRPSSATPRPCPSRACRSTSAARSTGCSRSGLDEVRAWLDAPGNEDEVLLVYLQNELDGDPAAHAATVAELDRALGDLVARPPGAVPGSVRRPADPALPSRPAGRRPPRAPHRQLRPRGLVVLGVPAGRRVGRAQQLGRLPRLPGLRGRPRRPRLRRASHPRDRGPDVALGHQPARRHRSASPRSARWCGAGWSSSGSIASARPTRGSPRSCGAGPRIEPSARAVRPLG